MQQEIEKARLSAVRRYDILDTPPDEAFDRITRIAARIFDVPIAIVSIVDEDRIWFKSHLGLDIDQIPRDPGLCASAILQGKPWIISDAVTDPRTMANPLVASEFGLRFYAGIPLRTNDGYNLGTVCVIDKVPRQPTEKEIENLRDLAGIVMDELELRLVTRKEMHKKDSLFAELHHRVKNNLQVVSSLLSLQSRSIDESVRGPIRDSLQRIEAIALLNQMFYEKHETESLELGPYLENLARLILQTYGMTKQIVLRFDLEPVSLTLDRATPLYLLITEVISNACKHAFPSNDTGSLTIHLREADGEILLSVHDDGTGCGGYSIGEVGSMGTKLIAAFSRQLGGHHHYTSARKGTHFHFRMPRSL